MKTVKDKIIYKFQTYRVNERISEHTAAHVAASVDFFGFDEVFRRTLDQIRQDIGYSPGGRSR